MKFTLFFFSSDAETDRPYDLLLQVAEFADARGFTAIWTPERHFDRFGGPYANPAITSAALATITRSIALRSGSLISPLHDVVRVAEAWAMVDQLSRGRVGISLGSGWNANDFVFFPDRFQRRHAVLEEQIATLSQLWRGERVSRPGPLGPVEVEIFPKPYQRRIPLWLTTSGSPRTFQSAGRLGANVLTHMIMQDRSKLAEHIRQYRHARAEAGFDPAEGTVSLMLHTFVGRDEDAVRTLVRPSFREYLRSAVKLEVAAAGQGGTISGGLHMDREVIPDDLVEELLDMTFERYYETASCMGSVDRAYERVRAFADIGVDEIACLIDFGVEPSLVLESLEDLDRLRQRFA